MGEAVSYLHALPSGGVVHGDISAANVLISDAGDALLSDFGSARVSSACKTGTTSAGVFKGTEGYKAVEIYNQMEKKTKTRFKARPASDVYAFGGLILHVSFRGNFTQHRAMLTGLFSFASQVLTGAAPFYKVPSPVMIETEIRAGRFSQRRDYPRIPKNATIWDVMERCWQTDSLGRPTMTEVLRELEDERACYAASGSFRVSVTK